MSGLNDVFYDVGSGPDDARTRFNNLEDFVVSEIKRSTAVIGCVNYLTSKKIINALAQLKDGMSIIMDKSTVSDNRKKGFPRGAYGFKHFKALKFKIMSLDEQYVFGGHYELNCSDADAENTDPVRVFGCVVDDGQKKILLHHKFLVFCELHPDGFIQPLSVITGSYNFTENGSRCRENIIHLRGAQYADGYYGEWRSCFLMSESLDEFKNDVSPVYIKQGSVDAIRAAIKEEYEKIDAVAGDPYYGA